MRNLILFILLFINSLSYSNTPDKKIRVMSYREYKYALKEFYKDNFQDTLNHVEKSLELHPRNKKSRELLHKLRKIGLDYMETGEALVYFDKKLATKYLKIANALMDQKYEIKKIKKIQWLLNHIKTSEETSSDSI